MDTLASIATQRQAIAAPAAGAGQHAATAGTMQSRAPHTGVAGPAPAASGQRAPQAGSLPERRPRMPSHAYGSSQANFTSQGQQDPADVLLSALIDVSQIRYVQNQTTAVLHADEYANR